MPINRFKLCNSCNRWLSAEDILSNPVVYPIGLAAHGVGMANLFFYFVHHVPDCMSTIMISAAELAPFVLEKTDQKALLGSEDCPGHCTDLHDLRECSMNCQHAAFRRFYQTLQANRREPKSRINLVMNRSSV